MALACVVRSGVTPYCACSPAEMGAEPGENFVHDEDDAVLIAACPQQLQEAGLGRDAAGVVVDPFADHGGELVAMPRHGRLEGGDVIPGHHDHVVRGGLRHSAGGRDDRALRIERIGVAIEPGLGQAVKVTVEFQVLAAAGGVTGDAQRDQRHLAADAGEAHPLGGGDDLDQPRCQLLVVRRLGGADDPHVHACQHGPLHRGVIVTEQGGAIGEVEVDVPLAIDAVEIGAFAATDVERPPEIRVQPHRGGDTSGQHRLRLLEESASGSATIVPLIPGSSI